MSVLAELSLERIAKRLPEFPGETLPDRLVAGRSAAEAVLRSYVPDFAFDVGEAEAVTRRVDAWAERNERTLSDAIATTDGDLPAALRLAMGSALEVQQFLLSSFTLAAAGLGPWTSGELAAAVARGEHAEAWALIDAQSRLATFGLIVAMERDGDLSPIFRPAAASGLGALPAAAWIAIVIITVVFAAAVVTYVYLNRRLTLNNRLMREICERAQREGDTAVVRECIKATRDLQVSMFEELGGKVATALVLVGAAYLALTFGPGLLKRTLGERRRA